MSQFLFYWENTPIFMLVITFRAESVFSSANT